jgi:hypothetical protein
MVQPLVAQKFFGDPLLRDQGLHSRFLTAMPDSIQGTRISGEEDPDNFSGFSDFSGVMKAILRKTLTLGEAKELLTRALPLTEIAKQLWHRYANGNESQLGPGGGRELIAGLANKLPEQAARIAAILASIDNIDALEVDHNYLAGGIEISEYYANEAIRIYSYSQVRHELTLAQRLYDWLQVWGRDHERLVSLPDIYQFGPNPIGDKAMASRLVTILADHGYLEKHDGPAEIAGKTRREVWRIYDPLAV